MLKFEHQNVNLHYQIEGSGETLLFLHGFLENHTMWKDLIPHFLEQGYCCITLDLPCHGKSRFQGEICQMVDMAELVDKLLQHLNIEVHTIIAHSMGGYVGLELIQLRSAQLILLHSNFWDDNPQKKIDRNRIIKIAKKNKSFLIKEAIPTLFTAKNKVKCAAQINEIIEDAKKIPAEEIAAATAGMRDRKSFVSNLDSERIAIIQGEHDPIIATADIKQLLLANNYKVPLVELKNVGHMSIWEDPKNLIKALKNLIIR